MSKEKLGHAAMIVANGHIPWRLSIPSARLDIGMVDRTYRLYSEEELIRSAKHHREIADAVAAHAPDWARTAMQTHVRAAEAAAIRSVQAPKSDQSRS